jgi:hypothetical protein
MWNMDGVESTFACISTKHTVQKRALMGHAVYKLKQNKHTKKNEKKSG